jgi:hypothetical protein
MPVRGAEKDVLRTAVGVLAATALVTAACRDASNPTGPGTGAVEFSFAVAAPGNPLRLTAAGHTLEFRQVQLTLDKLELVSTVDASGRDCNRDVDHTCVEFYSDPLSVDLPLAGGRVTAATISGPLWGYGGVEVEIDSARVQGVYDGVEVEASLRVGEEANLLLPTVLRLTPASPSRGITITVDVLRWFRNPDGSLLDPRVLDGSSSARALMRQQIMQSFTASVTGR